MRLVGSSRGSIWTRQPVNLFNRLKLEDIKSNKGGGGGGREASVDGVDQK